MNDAIADMAAPHAPQRSLQRSVTQIPTQQPTPKVSRLFRISSYIGLGSVSRAGSPTTSTFPEVVMRSESMKSRAASYGEAAHDRSTGIWRTGNNMESDYDNFRESDRTWHSPNVVQTMETVSCAMMVNGISEPIPRHLNASIMSMVEEFRIHLGKLKKLQADIDELRDARRNEAKEFANMAHEWEVREFTFKAEIKRLEHIISRTQDGAESVILARAGSIVDRNDGKEFQGKLDRLSRSKDVASGYDADLECINMEQMRTSLKLPDTTLDDRPKLIADHDRDVRLTELLTRKGMGQAPKQGKVDTDLRERMAAAWHFYNTTGRPCPPTDMTTKKPPARISRSSTTSSSSKMSRTSSSSSLDAQGADHVTPRTTPAPQRNITISSGGDALVTIQEILKVNGGLPEDAVDDGSGSDPSFIPSCNTRTFSVAAGDNNPAGANGLVTSTPNIATTKKDHKQPRVQHSNLLVVPETRPISQFNGERGRKDVARPTGLQRQDSGESFRPSQSSSSSGSFPTSRRSPPQKSVGYKHATGRNVDNSNAKSGGLPESKASSRQGSMSSASAGSSPSRKVQSALDITLSQETIEAARRERTIDNHHTKTSSFIRPEDFRVLPPQPTGYLPHQTRPRYTTGPPPGLPVHPLLRRGPARPPVSQARGPEMTGNQEANQAITAGTASMTRSASQQSQK